MANVTFSPKQSGVPVGFAICGAVLPTLALDFGWRWAATSVGVVALVTAIVIQPLRALYDDGRASAFGRIFWGELADALRKPSLALAGIGCIVVAAVVTMAMTGPDWPPGAVYAVCIVLGGTAVGWNGVFITESAFRAPPGRAAEFTGVAQLFVFFGALLSPLVFRGALYVTHSCHAGYLLLGAGVAVCTFFMARAALNRRG